MWNLSLGMLGWARYALIAWIYGFFHQLGEDSEGAAKKSDGDLETAIAGKVIGLIGMVILAALIIAKMDPPSVVECVLP